MLCKGKMMTYSIIFLSKELVIQAMNNLRPHEKTPLKKCKTLD